MKEENVKEVVSAISENVTPNMHETGNMIKLAFTSVKDMVEVAVNNYGTQAADVALMYLRVDAFFGSLWLLLIGIGMLWFANKWITAGIPDSFKILDDSRTTGIFGYKTNAVFCDERFLHVAGTIIFGIVGLGVIFDSITNPWHWVGMFMPELYAINMAMEAAVK